MRTLCLPAMLLSLVACAAPAHLVRTADDTSTTIADAARALAMADVVVLGEMHETPAVHELHHALLEALYERRGNVAIAMEMFERDVQAPLLQYLSGMIGEKTFLERSRPWQNYERDYRPVIEFAKAHGLVVFAANAPTELARKVAREGIASVAGSPYVARETSAPEDEYYDEFTNAMGGHVGTGGDGAMQRMYAAQCLKDDTMAETVVDYLKKEREVGGHPLVVLICGNMHSNFRRGVVARMASRMPELDIRVLSAEGVADLGAGRYDSPRKIGDYVVVVQEAPEPEMAKMLPPEHPPVAGPVPVTPTAVAVPVDPHALPAGHPTASSGTGDGDEGLRPALGLMPDYQADVKGVRVEALRPGGPAERAGMQDGDVIVKLGGMAIEDVQGYVEALDAQTIGSMVAVRVRRGEAEVDLQVQVASRSR